MAASLRQQLFVKNKIDLTHLLNIGKSQFISETRSTSCFIRHKHRQSSSQSSSKSSLMKPGNKADEARSAGQKNNLDDIDNEDFFGIPHEYKLQNFRFGASSSRSPFLKAESTVKDPEILHIIDNTTNNSEQVRGPSAEIQQSRHKRRRKRANKTVFPTSFGIISFDQTAYNEAEGQQHDRLSVSGLLPALVSMLPHSFQANQLHIVQGLDRDTTGALILAKTPELAQDLKLMYNNSDTCIQRFWAITKGVPKHPDGTVDIPIGEGRIAGRFRPMLRPLYRQSIHPGVKLSKAPSQAAVTEYKVLSRNETAALIECTPLTTGVKHQLRVHLAHALNTPILGDHKYSHLAKLAPQKLDPDTLARLKIRQAKVRHLSLHLHLRSVVLTNYKGRMIFLTTRPSVNFVDNLRNNDDADDDDGDVDDDDDNNDKDDDYEGNDDDVDGYYDNNDHDDDGDDDDDGDYDDDNDGHYDYKKSIMIMTMMGMTTTMVIMMMMVVVVMMMMMTTTMMLMMMVIMTIMIMTMVIMMMIIAKLILM
ncbi:RNA pseudouridylate synthase domain-containing protein 4 [Elysia marginata]|uniref:Pseudouridylate synthase RPUSD4, mitochondrial n=1 Tax=Elysia marginata TaxID=1093978 RepID=A0AAV4HWI7_9GAST|nr:RNA pseudouridylate synthase domain-containing protein 4 [Elysia marginata]